MARDIVGIDVHVHLSDEVTQKAKGDRTAQMAKYFGRERPPVSIDQMADQYRARKMMAVIMNTRDETITGLTPVPNDYVAEAVKKHPDVFLAFGALQFVADAPGLVTDVARVLRPGGVFAFSITHPTRWMFLDDPGEEGLVAQQSYWDRTPYVEVDNVTGETRYVEHHRTLGDWVGALSRNGFVLTDLHEPEWPADHDRTWGGWSRMRGVLTPGSAIFVTRLAAHATQRISPTVCPSGSGR